MSTNTMSKPEVKYPMDTNKLGLTIFVIGSLYTQNDIPNQPNVAKALGDEMSLDQTAFQGFNVISHSLIPIEES